VKITRDKHPLEGRALDVLGQTHRDGVLCLTLVLPDGSKSLIPAAWTDLEEGDDLSTSTEESRPAARRLIGSVSDLLHARKVVDALLRRLDPSHEGKASTTREEARHAAGAISDTGGTTTEAGGLGAVEPGRATRGHSHPRADDDQGDAAGCEEG
jgi:hypothetical protein